MISTINTLCGVFEKGLEALIHKQSHSSQTRCGSNGTCSSVFISQIPTCVWCPRAALGGGCEPGHSPAISKTPEEEQPTQKRPHAEGCPLDTRLAPVPGALCGLWTATGSPRWLLSQSVSLSDVTQLRQEGWRFVMEAVTDKGDVSKKVQPFSVKDS